MNIHLEVLVAAMALAGCAANTSSTGAGVVVGDGGSDSSGATDGGTSSYDAVVDYDAAVAACAQYSSGVERMACCQQQIPRGYLTLHVAEQDCLCGSTGPCTGACNYQDCTSLEGSTPNCQSCLDTNLAGSCKPTVAAACASDPGCSAYQVCVAGGGS